MGNFVIECPVCGAMHPASNSIFSRKTINCSCGRVIDIRKDSLITDECPHCGNKIVIDARKGDKAICPVCKKPVHTREDINNLVKIRCPQCACELNVKKPNSNNVEILCPICDSKINVSKVLQKQKVTESNLISVIKYEGNNDTLVWKHPIEDFNAGSQLIVHESQVAVFYRDGIAMDTFPSGAYTLNAKSLPLIGDTFKIPADAGIDTIFHSEIYFVNLVTHLGYKWGTPSRIRLIDPITGMHIDIGARGSMNIRISDARKLLVKLVGTGDVMTRDDLQADNTFGKAQQTALASFFRDIIVARVRTHLSKSIKNEKIDLMEIDERLDDLSESLQSIINESLEEYGFALDNFLITNVDLPTDNEAYLKLKKLHDERILKVSEKSAERDYVQADAEIAYAKKAQEQTLNIMTASNEAQVARINVEKAKAEADAIIARAQAEAEVTRLSGIAEAEVTRLSGVASADAYAAQARAEAEEMHSKGYTYQQETSRQIGIEAMQNGLPGTGNTGSAAAGTVGSAVSDMIGIGMTLGTVGAVVGMAKDTINPIIQDVSQIGKQFTDNQSGPATWNCACGKKNITSKFCPECGTPMPVPVQTANSIWNCSCGCTNISSKFCPDCGQKNPFAVDTWVCRNCGTADIKSKFCPNCGQARGV